MGKFSPNVWHNPTIILSSAASIWFTLVLLEFVKYPNVVKGVFALFLLTVSAFAKPNYALAVCLALPVLPLFRNFRSKGYLALSFSIFLVLGLIFTLQWRLFQEQLFDREIRFMPFFVINQRSSFLPLTILSSICFPLCLLILVPKASKDVGIQFSWSVFIVAVLQALTLVEGNGTRQFLHGNWYWGAHQALTVLFAVSGQVLARLCQVCGEKTSKALFIILGAHFLSGVAYLIKLYLGKGFA